MRECSGLPQQIPHLPNPNFAGLPRNYQIGFNRSFQSLCAKLNTICQVFSQMHEKELRRRNRVLCEGNYYLMIRSLKLFKCIFRFPENAYFY